MVEKEKDLPVIDEPAKGDDDEREIVQPEEDFTAEEGEGK